MARARVFGFPVSLLDGLFLTILFAVVIAGCAPTQQIVADTINSERGDQAQVFLVGSDDLPACEGAATVPGICILPGDEPMLNVDVSIGGTNLQLGIECDDGEYGPICELGEVTEPTHVPVRGERVSATVAYEREGRDGSLFELAVPLN